MKNSIKVISGVISTSIGMVAVGQTVQAEEVVEPVTPIEQQEVKEVKSVTETTENKVKEQQTVVKDEQAKTDEAKKIEEQANDALTKQQEQAKKDADELAKKEAELAQQQKELEDAEKAKEEATPEAIEKGQEEVNKNQTNVNDQEKIVDDSKKEVENQQTVVSDKAKEETAASEQAKKDADELAQAEKEKAEKEEILANIEAEKAKAEKEKAEKEADLAKKEAAEKESKDNVTKQQEETEKAEKNVKESQDKVNAGNEDIKNKENDLSEKEKTLKDSQNKVDEATGNYNDKVDELNGHKGIILPENFTPDYYNKLSENDIKVLEKAGLDLNKLYPTSKEDEAKKAVLIDVNNMTDTQKQSLSEFAVGLINDIRKLFGLEEFKVSKQAINFATEVAKNSDNTKYSHDNIAINESAKNNGLYHSETHPQNLYENLGSSLADMSTGKISEYDLERMIRENIVAMLLDDGIPSYGHLYSLMRDGSRNMGVAFSIKSNKEILKIHFLSFGKEYVVDQTKFDEGVVPSFKSLEELENELVALEAVLDELEENEVNATAERDNAVIVLNQAKSSQKTLDSNLSNDTKRLNEAKAALAQLKAVYQEKVADTKVSQDNLSAINTKLQTINDLITNSDAVLQEAQSKVTNAENVATQSAKVLKEKQEALKVEQDKLLEKQAKVTQSRNELETLKTVLEASQKALDRLEQAEPNYEKALQEVETAKENLEQAKILLAESTAKVEALKIEHDIAEKAYVEAKTQLDKEKEELARLEKELKAENDKKAEVERKESLEKLVKAEQERLAKEKDNKQVNISWKKPTQATKSQDTPKVLKASITSGKTLPQTDESKSLVGYIASWLGVLLVGLSLSSKGLKREED